MMNECQSLRTGQRTKVARTDNSWSLIYDGSDVKRLCRDNREMGADM